MTTREYMFRAGETGLWRVEWIKPVIGATLPDARAVSVIGGGDPAPPGEAIWTLRGVTSNERYATRAEKMELLAKSPPLGRPEATRAALIPIRKTAEWWALPQDERRAILEERSRHIKVGINYLPAVARRLHHCRDLGEEAPFDFLTWFEFAPADARAFDDLVAELRSTEEWTHVEREVEIRLSRGAI